VADGYRPITLLSTLGKTFEKILNTRIVEHYNEVQPLHQRQFGFRRGIGTEEAVHQAVDMLRTALSKERAVAGISLDIKGAFDYASWSCILSSLHDAHTPHYIVNCIKSYFDGRQVHCGTQMKDLNRGCPQGSVLGPTLWNIVYDHVIRILERWYPDTCVYADDTFIIVTANTAAVLKMRVESCITRVNNILAEIGLELSINKTEVLTRIRKPLWQRVDAGPVEDFHYNVSGTILHPKECIKYLGVKVDNKLSFRDHLDYIIEKSKKRLPLMQGLCRNMYGYQYQARKIMLNSYILSLLMHCSSIYYQRLQLKTYRQKIEKLQRRTNIIICRVYRSISGMSVGLLAAEEPLSLRIVERSVHWLIRKGRPVQHWGHLTRVEDTDDGLVRDGHPITLPEARKLWKEDTLRKWEQEWAEYPLSQWTHSLFPTVESALNRDWEPSFWSSQAMTGHGVFKAHLAGRGLASSDDCPCGFGPETAEHVLRECLRFTSGRPPDWSRVTVDHVRYMERTVTRLWEVENPHFKTRRTPSQ